MVLKEHFSSRKLNHPTGCYYTGSLIACPVQTTQEEVAYQVPNYSIRFCFILWKYLYLVDKMLLKKTVLFVLLLRGSSKPCILHEECHRGWSCNYWCAANNTVQLAVF